MVNSAQASDLILSTAPARGEYTLPLRPHTTPATGKIEETYVQAGAEHGFHVTDWAMVALARSEAADSVKRAT